MEKNNNYSFYALMLIIVVMLIGGWNNCNGQYLMPVDGYWYTWDVDDGVLYDDGDAAGFYTNNGLGALTIYPLDRVNDKIVLRFIDFDVEYQGSCAYDILEVYEGEAMSTLLGAHCGTTIPPIYTSTDPTGALTIYWSSDGSVAGAGFKIDISVVSPATTVEVGDPNSTTTNGRVPSYGYYDFSWSALIYGSSDIGMPITIDEIQFDVENDINTTMTNQRIYIAHTTMNMFPNGNEPLDGDIGIADWALVYSGDITWTQGWNSITLDNTFMYNGVGNLLVKTTNEDGKWTMDYPLYRYTSRANTVVYNYADGAMPGSPGFRNSYRPNMRFGFGGGGGALPIVLTSFTSEVTDNNSVNLIWAVASQVNNDYFTIERSSDCYNWEVLENINGSGTNNTHMYYSISDDDPIIGTSYYRLSQTDFNGEFESFNPISVDVNDNITIGLSIIPNPAIDNIQLRLMYPDQSFINHNIKIYNSKGDQVYKKFYIGRLEDFNINIKKFKPGYYIVKSRSDELFGEGKFIKK